MIALVHSLRRIWFANNRVPRLTGWGTRALEKCRERDARLFGRAGQELLELLAAVRRTVPTLVIVALNIFR